MRRPAGATTIVSNDATAACWAEHADRRWEGFGRRDHGDARDGDRGRGCTWWEARRGRPRFCRRDQPHGYRPARPTLPMWEKGLLGAVRLGSALGRSGKGSGPSGAAQYCGRASGRRRGGSAGRARHPSSTWPGTPEAVEVISRFFMVDGAPPRQPGQRLRPLRPRPREVQYEAEPRLGPDQRCVRIWLRHRGRKVEVVAAHFTRGAGAVGAGLLDQSPRCSANNLHQPDHPAASL